MSESNDQMVNRKGDAASMFLNEVFERVEGKLMGLEQNVNMMGMEQRKEKENSNEPIFLDHRTMC